MGGSARAGGRAAGRVRIVAGRFGGRRLPVADVAGLRPTPERSRETLFNWLQGRMQGARVLDLFAGSGALGFEALSRGAAQVLFIERDRRVCATLSEVAAGLDAERCQVVQADALRWLTQAAANPVSRFDLVLLDPPFGAGLAARALAALHASALLADDARIYCEVAASDATPAWLQAGAGSWLVLRETRAGDSRGALLERAAGREESGPA